MATSDPATLVWNHSSSTGTERVVLLALAKFADDDGYCWPGLGTLVPMANVTERAVQAAIAKLVSSGELATLRGRGRGHHTLYRILLGQPEGAGDPDVMLAWLRTKTTPHLAAMYDAAEPLRGLAPGKVQSASPITNGGKVQSASPIQEGKGEAERRERVKQSVETPAAYRNELPVELLPPSVVPPDGGPAEPGNVIALRSDRAVAAVNGTLGRLQAEVAEGRKSWSLSEAAKAEWLDLLADDRNLATAQQFIVAYLALNTGRDVRSFDRLHWSMAGRQVARWRAMVLYGVDQAITRIDPDEPDDRGRPGRPFWAYVEAVCRDARHRSNGTAPEGNPA